MIDIPPRTLILTVFLTGAAAGDSYSGKIRNYWILPACIAGLLNGFFPYGTSGRSVPVTSKHLRPLLYGSR